MGNTCCHKPEKELVLNTLDTEQEEKENEYTKDKYPHDSDSAFKTLKNKEKKTGIKPLSNDDIIQE